MCLLYIVQTRFRNTLTSSNPSQDPGLEVCYHSCMDKCTTMVLEWHSVHKDNNTTMYGKCGLSASYAVCSSHWIELTRGNWLEKKSFNNPTSPCLRTQHLTRAGLWSLYVETWKDKSEHAVAHASRTFGCPALHPTPFSHEQRRKESPCPYY